jgi:hypothetical protein
MELHLQAVDQQLHTYDERPYAKILRYVALVHLSCRLEAGAKMEEGRRVPTFLTAIRAKAL